ncbi:MAG: hypothetical protein P1U81_07395 [Verrucomicrobiales bacterium]|nr:hypothetical protein [Verrucomicrobiales bacterium]
MVGLALASWQRDALRRFGNEWTAERHLIKAQQKLEVGNDSVAVRRAITSLQLEPNRLDTIRVLIEAARKTEDSRLILLAQMIFTHQEATVTDKISALAAINDVRDARRFELFREAFPEESRALIPARIEYVRYLVHLERLSQAIQIWKTSM